MRFHLLGMLLMAARRGAGRWPSARETLERRIERLEQQLRAVQRRVFPGGRQVEPEIGAAAPRRRQAAPPPATRSPTSPPGSTRSRRSFAS